MDVERIGEKNVRKFSSWRDQENYPHINAKIRRQENYEPSDEESIFEDSINYEFHEKEDSGIYYRKDS
jgi:hypothetical protein